MRERPVKWPPSFVVAASVGPERLVIVAIEPDDWIAVTRQFARSKVAAEGLSDADIDRLIEQAQREVETAESSIGS